MIPRWPSALKSNTTRRRHTTNAVAESIGNVEETDEMSTVINEASVSQPGQHDGLNQGTGSLPAHEHQVQAGQLSHEQFW